MTKEVTVPFVGSYFKIPCCGETKWTVQCASNSDLGAFVILYHEHEKEPKAPELEVKPCPTCGVNPRLESTTQGLRYVCKNVDCGLRPSTCWRGTEAGVAYDWNKRWFVGQPKRTPEEPELKPCPFCGRPGSVELEAAGFVVLCVYRYCSFRPRMRNGRGTRLGAISAWNAQKVSP